MKTRKSCGTIMAANFTHGDRMKFSVLWVHPIGVYPLPHRKDGTMERIRGLDLLRAIAILWVMLFHAFVAELHLPFEAVFKFGWMGVDLFFALSGYLIGSQLFKSYCQQNPLSWKQFYLRRAFRILPAYWVIVVLYFTIPVFREDPGIQPLWQFLTFTVNLLIDYKHNRAFSQAWSLCIEEHFYLCFPWIVMVLMKKPSIKKAASVCIGLFVFGLFIRGYLWIVELYPHRIERDGMIRLGRPYFELIYFPTYSRIDGLLAGVMVAGVKYFRPTWWKQWMEKKNVLLILSSLGLLACILMFRDRQSFIASVIGYPLLAASFALLVAAAASPHSRIGSLRIPFVSNISTLAYSLYLTHKQIFHLTSLYLPDWVAAGGYQALLVHSLFVFLGAAGLYWIVERPFLLLRNKFA